MCTELAHRAPDGVVPPVSVGVLCIQLLEEPASCGPDPNTVDTNAIFETSVGVIPRINDRTRVVVHAERGHPKITDSAVSTLVTENFHATVELDFDQFEDVFHDVEERRFGQTQTEYKEWAVDRLQDYTYP